MEKYEVKLIKSKLVPVWKGMHDVIINYNIPFSISTNVPVLKSRTKISRFVAPRKLFYHHGNRCQGNPTKVVFL